MYLRSSHDSSMMYDYISVIQPDFVSLGQNLCLDHYHTDMLIDDVLIYSGSVGVEEK